MSGNGGCASDGGSGEGDIVSQLTHFDVDNRSC